jgi:NAD(P)H-dependent FMN reductase
MTLHLDQPIPGHHERPQNSPAVLRPRIQIILGSTRQGRRGELVASWFRKEAEKRPEFEFEYLDLKDWDLPFFGTADSPLAANWQDRIAGGDGYIIITPEYNHSFSAALKNALDYGGKSWRNKPMAFVGYTAGDTGAARAVEQLRLVAIELQLAPIREAIHISGVFGALPESVHTESMSRRLERLFTQLSWWTEALKSARTERQVLA